MIFESVNKSILNIKSLLFPLFLFLGHLLFYDISFMDNLLVSMILFDFHHKPPRVTQLSALSCGHFIHSHFILLLLCDDTSINLERKARVELSHSTKVSILLSG
jgi:hypothetical protein